MRGLVPKAKIYLKRSAPTILTYAGVAGVIVTSFLTAKATPKAVQILENLDEVKEETEERVTVVKKILAVAPVYVPSIMMGVSTITCILGANVLNKRRQAALVSACTFINNSYKEYRNKLIELHGKEADIEIRDAIVREHCDYHQIDIDIPDTKLIFYEKISGETLVRYEKEIMDAEYHLNRNFVLRGYAPLNEFYEFLGLPQTDYGSEIGWSAVNGYCWIDFEHRLVSMDDGTKAYVIDMVFSPDSDYLDGWEW